MLGLQTLVIATTSLFAISSHARTIDIRTDTPVFVCPTADITATKCMGPKDCLYPNPKTCNGFIQCSPADGSYTTGIVHEMPCPSGLLWNDKQKWCDWPANSTCDVKAGSGTAVDATKQGSTTNSYGG